MLEPQIPLPVIVADIQLLDPEDETNVIETIHLRASATRQRLHSNRRCSIYKHVLDIELTQPDGPVSEHTAMITARTHPRADVLDHLQWLLRATYYKRLHTCSRKPKDAPPSPPPTSDL